MSPYTLATAALHASHARWYLETAAKCRNPMDSRIRLEHARLELLKALRHCDGDQTTAERLVESMLAVCPTSPLAVSMPNPEDPEPRQ